MKDYKKEIIEEMAKIDEDKSSHYDFVKKLEFENFLRLKDWLLEFKRTHRELCIDFLDYSQPLPSRNNLIKLYGTEEKLKEAETMISFLNEIHLYIPVDDLLEKVGDWLNANQQENWSE